MRFAAILLATVVCFQDKPGLDYFREAERILEMSGEDRRRAIQEADSWPPFYKEMLQAESHVVDSLGNPLLSMHRASLKEDLKPLEQIQELRHQTGLPFTIQGDIKRMESEEPIFPNLKDVPAVRAFLDIASRREEIPCWSERHRAPYWNDEKPHFYFRTWNAGWSSWSFRDLGLTAVPEGFSKSFDFSDRAQWTLAIQLMPLDPTRHVEAWLPHVELIAAETNKGEKLTSPPPRVRPAVRWTDVDASEKDEPDQEEMSVPLATSGPLPDAIRILRVRAVGLVVRGKREYSLTDDTPQNMKISDVLADIVMGETSTKDGKDRKITLTIRPKKVKLDHLKRVLRAKAEFNGGHSQVPFRITENDGALTLTMEWWPENAKTTLSRVRLELPMEVIERPVYAEFKDIKLKK